MTLSALSSDSSAKSSNLIYDLHCHSDQSDGILSPEALVSRAKAQNVSVLALTDHDTVAGVARAQQQAQVEGLDIIPGIEFSSQWNGRGVHIVGLNIDLASPSLLSAVHQQEQQREERAHQIAEKLESMGVARAYEGARQHAPEGVVGRPHFAAYLVEQGHCKNIAQAFKKYLGAGKPGDIKQMWPELEEVVQWVLQANGTAVLAHPKKYNMTRTKLCAMVADFKEAGGQAIEVVSGKQLDADTRDIARIAQKYSLLGSCGSDFHSPGGAWQELGNFPKLPESIEPVWSSWQ
ncbi:5'-3' exoribonuclease [Thalassocella blandensis]|nr:5'-3' exoribonuclease [Thalassocella blandensis]